MPTDVPNPAEAKIRSQVRSGLGSLVSARLVALIPGQGSAKDAMRHLEPEVTTEGAKVRLVDAGVLEALGGFPERSLLGAGIVLIRPQDAGILRMRIAHAVRTHGAHVVIAASARPWEVDHYGLSETIRSGIAFHIADDDPASTERAVTHFRTMLASRDMADFVARFGPGNAEIEDLRQSADARARVPDGEGATP